MLVLRYIVNGYWFEVDTDGIGYETALAVPVSRFVVNGACFTVDTD